MKTAILIDDEALARSIVKSYLMEHKEIEIIAECSNGFEGVKAIEKHRPDILFLDIQMPKINGFEMLELLDYKPTVIFTTAYDEYAIKAFETNALDYLLKPFTQERFNESIAKISNFEINQSPNKIDQLLESSNQIKHRIVIKEGSNIIIIPAEKIHFIEAYDDYVKIHTKEKTYLKKQTMTHLEQTLNKADFIRIHRSYILNIQSLTKIVSYEKNSYRAILVSGDEIPISRNSYSNLKHILGL